MNNAFNRFCSPGFNKGTGSCLYTLPLNLSELLHFLWNSISCTHTALFPRFIVNMWQNKK